MQLPPILVFLCSLVVLLCVSLAGVVWGTADLSWSERYDILTRASDAPRGLSMIVWQWRMPRVIAVALIGAMLTLAGVLMQATLRNSMADPYILGLSSGASAAAVAALIWLPEGLVQVIGVPVISFIGAGLAFALTLSLSMHRGHKMDPHIVILAGIAVSLMFQSVTSFFLYLGDPHATRSAMGWLMGTAAGTSWADLPLLVLSSGLVAGLALRHAAALDAMLLGDQRALALGVRVDRLRLIAFLAAVLLTGLAVSVAGIVGFVGLILPHLARLLVGARHRAMIPVSMVLGAAILVCVDLLCRTLLAPEELPLGVLLALFAAPPFVLILRRTRRVA